jgi:hypothetical protein
MFFTFPARDSIKNMAFQIVTMMFDRGKKFNSVNPDYSFLDFRNPYRSSN